MDLIDSKNNIGIQPINNHKFKDEINISTFFFSASWFLSKRFSVITIIYKDVRLIA